jgi:hypothetical protein
MSAELSPGEVRAAAEVHRELGPEYSDAVVEAFLERVDRQIAERVDREVAARVGERPGATARQAPVQQAPSNNRLMLLLGVTIGIFVTGVPSVMVAASGGGVLAKDETDLLVAIGIILALVVAVAAYVRRPAGRGTARDR